MSSTSLTRNPNLDILSLRAPSLFKGTNNDQAQINEELVGPRPKWWWTGRPPEYGVCPGVQQDGKISSLPELNLAQCSRQNILDYFDNTWTLTEVLFSSLQGIAAFYQAPYHQLRHPLIFYYCHPAALYINKLLVAGVLDRPINPYFEQLFETGVDEMSWDDLSKNEMEWPPIISVHQYRKQVYETVKSVIETAPELENSPITPEHPLWALCMGFEHERIHLETSSVLIRELPLSLVRCPDQWPAIYPIKKDQPSSLPKVGENYPVNKMLPVVEQTVTLGKPYDWPTYGWDNEYGLRTVHVGAFHASKYLISNGEFYQFVIAGGYQKKQYWSNLGWKWRTFRNVKWPTFWVANGPAGAHQYKLRTCFELTDMPWSCPVNVNYHEAKAYCTWRTEQDHPETSYRVITEAEHHLLRSVPSSQDNSLDIFKFGESITTKNDSDEYSQNINLVYGSETPVDALEPTDAGFYDVFGNVWEWCEDDFNPLPGFRVHPIYDDFSTPCFDDEHTMIMGGSFISTGDESSIWARFHFRPHFFQHAGFRIVYAAKDTTPNAVDSSIKNCNNNSYESSTSFNEYMLLHYGAVEKTMPFDFGPQNAVNFPVRCAQLVMNWVKELGIKANSALDLGCAVGRSSFEMARLFEQVIGLDLSASFVDAANTLKRDGSMHYSCIEEGHLGDNLLAKIDPDIPRDRVFFQRADACSIPPHLVNFDAVLAANLLCRLVSPKACLARMGGARGLVRSGGILVLASPYTWMKDFTPKEAWLGGYKKNETPCFSATGIKDLLGGDFNLLHEDDMPLVIREHRRKYQYIVSHIMIWQRK